MMLGYYVFMAFLIAGMSVGFGYALGSIMTTAKIAHEQAEKHRKESQDGDIARRK